MTAAEAISELDGLISRNGFYDAMRRNEIPNVNLGRLKAVPRDFVSQLKERALRKLDEPRDRKTGLACQRPSLQNKMDDNEG